MRHAQSHVFAFPLRPSNHPARAALEAMREKTFDARDTSASQQATAPGFIRAASQPSATPPPSSLGAASDIDVLLARLAADTSPRRLAPDLNSPTPSPALPLPGVKTTGDLSPSQRQAVITSLRRSIVAAAPGDGGDMPTPSYRRVKMAGLAALLAAGALGSGLVIIQSSPRLSASPPKIAVAAASFPHLTGADRGTAKADYVPTPVTTMAVSDPSAAGQAARGDRSDSPVVSTPGLYIPEFRPRGGTPASAQQGVLLSPAIAPQAGPADGIATPVDGADLSDQRPILPSSTIRPGTRTTKPPVAAATNERALTAPPAPAKTGAAVRRNPSSSTHKPKQTPTATASHAVSAAPLVLHPSLAAANPPARAVATGVKAASDHLADRSEATGAQTDRPTAR